MTKLWLDFETYSDLDIQKAGMYKYVNHPSFHPWCAAYAIDDEDTKLWVRGDTAEDLHKSLYDPEIKIYAHNADFEHVVLKSMKYDLPVKRFVDTRALAATFGYPLGLDKFCKAVGSPVLKSAKGTRLLNKLCKPQNKTVKNPLGRWFPDTAPQDFSDLYSYCVQDVESMRHAVNKLPTDELSSLEQYIWGHTVLQNERGVKIDIESVKKIRKILRMFKLKGEQRLQTATGGTVKTPKQVKKLKEFLNDRGLDMPNLAKATVEEYLAGDTRTICREVLELRKQLAHSSVAKFDKMQLMCEKDSRVRGNLVYHGAHTGRFAGRGVQLHNLPRASVANPDEVIADFNLLSYQDILDRYPDVNETAMALIRPMITAESGSQLIVADYSSIENRVLHWLAGDEKTLDDFKKGVCQYKMYSASRLNIKYEEVTKEQRTESKPDVLGLGYGGGYRALVSVAAGYGVALDNKSAQERVNFYRKKYHLIPKLWKKVFNKVLEAVETKDPQVLITPTAQLEFRCAGGYLFILLPSGRRLSYPQVKLNATWEIKVKGRQVPMSSVISYMGVRQSTWARIGTHPGMLVENIVQALARDILVYGMLCAEQAGYKIIASVHDEAIAEVDESEGNLEDFCEYLCMKQKWAETIPLKAEGYVSKRYRKD